MKRELIFVLVLVGLVALVFYLNYGNVSFENKDVKVLEKGDYDSEEVLLKNFEEVFFNKYGEGDKTYYIYGNDEEVKVLTFEDVETGEVNFVSDNEQRLKTTESKYTLRKLIPEDNKVLVIIGGKGHIFNMEGENKIYFVVTENLDE